MPVSEKRSLLLRRLSEIDSAPPSNSRKPPETSSPLFFLHVFIDLIYSISLPVDMKSVHRKNFHVLPHNLFWRKTSKFIFKPASIGCSSRVWLFSASILQSKNGLCIYEDTACWYNVIDETKIVSSQTVIWLCRFPKHSNIEVLTGAESGKIDWFPFRNY